MVSNHGVEVLEIFLQHNVFHSVFPIISDVLIKRLDPYRTILNELLLSVFNGSKYLRLYKEYNVSVNVYGNLELIKNAGLCCAYEKILELVQVTKNNTDKYVFYGIGASDAIGADLVEKSSNFILEKNRVPTLSEQKKLYYSKKIDYADFLISFCSFKAHGMPPLICNRNTQQYYIPSPSVISFNEPIFRKILYDLIFRRNFSQKNNDLMLGGNSNLFEEYKKRREWVIGLGDKVGDSWIMKKN